MILLSPRMTRLAVLTLALILLTSLPTFRADRNPGSAFTPRVACAGGSPDETLKPSDNPPPSTQRCASITRHGTTVADARTIGKQQPYTRLTALQRWQFFTSVFRTLASRF